MRRRLNARFALALLGATVLSSGGVFLLHRVQVKRSAVGLLRQADRAEHEGRLEQADDYLGRYLGYRPDDMEAMARFALNLEKKAESAGARVQALGVLERVLSRDPDRPEVRRKAARLDVGMRLYADARQHLEILQKSTPHDGELEQLLGTCAEAEGNMTQAASWYQKAIDDSRNQGTASERVVSYAKLAHLLRRRLSDPKRADALMDALIADTKGASFRAYLERAVYRQQFKQQGVAEDVAAALKLAPEEADTLIAAAEVAGEAKDLERARGLLEKGVKRYPKDVRLYMLLARNSQQAGKAESARKWLEAGVAARPDATELRWVLAEQLLQAADFDGVVKQVDELNNLGYPPERLDYLRARLLVGRNEKLGDAGREKWAKAAAALERVQPLLAARADSAALARQAQLMLAECYEHLGDVTKQHAAYSRAVALDQPDDPAGSVARLGLARSLEAMGKTAEALDEYRRLATRDPSLKPVVARLMIRRNLELPPAQRRWPEVEQYIDQIAREKPDSPDPLSLRAEVLINMIPPQIDRARGELEKARDLQADQVEGWLPLVRLAELEGKPEAANKLIGEAERRLGDRVELRLARARIVAARGGDEAPKALGELAKNLEKLPEADRRRLQRGLAVAYSRIGDRKEAGRILDRLIEQAPDDLDAQLLSFDLALLDTDTAAMERRVRGIEKADKKDGALGKYSKVCMLVQKAKGEKVVNLTALKKARQRLADVTAIRPNWARGALAGAEIDDLAQSPDAAITGYLQAIDLGERNPAVFRRTVQLLTARGRFPEADLLMQRLLQWEQGAVAEDLVRASGASLRVGDYGRALDLARGGAAAEPARTTTATTSGWARCWRPWRSGRATRPSVRKPGRPSAARPSWAGKSPRPGSA